MNKFVRLILEIVQWTLLLGGVAHALPVAAAIGAFAGFLGSGTFLANIVLTGILTAVKIGIGLLTRANQPKSRTPGIKGDIQVGGDNPLSFIVGYYATAGQLEYANTYGVNSGDTPNAYMVWVISCSDLPVTRIAQPGDNIWVNGQKCTISSDLDPDGRGYGITEYLKDGVYYLWAKGRDGTQVAADSYLVAKFSADANRPYSSDMIGRGIADVIMTARFKRELFNGFPTFRFEIQGIKLYNPAKDSTNGGSGSHRWGTPSTYEYADDNATVIYNITRGIYYGSEWVYGGQNLPSAILPPASFIAAYNECRVDIALVGGGTEKQYRCGYEINVDQQPLDCIEEFLDGSSGHMSDVGGYYRLNIGAPGAAVYAFTDADIVATQDLNLDPFPGLEATYNGAHASYPEPGEAWAIKDAPPYIVPALETDDEGRRLLATLTFSTTPYNTQVQRLIKAAVEANRRFRRHVVPLPPEAWLLEPGDVVSWSSTREGYIDKEFLITAITGKQGMIQYVSLQEVDPSDYDWTPATDQKPISIGYLGSLIPAPQVIVGWSVAPATMYDATATARRPTIAVTYNGLQDDTRAVQVQVRLASDASFVSDGEIPYGTIDPLITAKTSLLYPVYLPNTAYEARGKFVAYSGRETTFSSWLSVTTPDVKIGITDFASGITPVELFSSVPPDSDPSNFEGRLVYDTTTGLLYTFTSGHFVLMVANNVLDDSITTAKIADAAITADKLMDDAVTALKILDGAVTNTKIANAAIDAAKLAAGAVTLTAFASGIAPVEILGTLPVTGNFDGRMVFLTTDKKLYRYNGTAAAFRASLATTDLTGQITAAQITANSITAAQIAADTITAGQIAAGAITASEIAAGAITAVAIATNTITADKLVANSITARELVLTDWTNLNSDPYFANQAAWQTVNAPYTFTTSAGAGANGANTFVDAIGAINLFIIGDPFPVNVGDQHTISIIAKKLTGATGTLAFFIQYLDAAGGTPGSSTSVSWTAADTTSYVTKTAFGTAPATAVAARLIVQTNTAITGAAYRIGFAGMYHRADANLIVDGAITAVKLAANSVTAASIAAGTITGDKLVANTITARELILTNFDNLADTYMASPSAWQAIHASATFRAISTIGYNLSGTDVAWVAGINTSQILISNWISVVAGEAYELGGVALFGTGGTVGNLRCYVAYWTGDQITATGNSILTAWTTANITSTARSAVSVAPASSVWARIVWDTNSTTPNVVSRIQLTSFRKRYDSNLIVDGAITAVKILANSITASQIAANTITAGQIAAGAISASELAANAVTAGKINAGAINVSTLFVNGVVVTGTILARAVTDWDTATWTIAATGTSGGFVRKATVNVDNQGGTPTSLFAHVDVTWNGSGSFRTDWRLVRTVSGVDTILRTFFFINASSSFDPAFLDITAPTGAYTYSIDVAMTSVGGGASVSAAGNIVSNWWKR